jgi:hypothetical protein
MTAIVCVAMCSLSAVGVIEVMRTDYQHNSRNQKPHLLGMQYLFQHEEDHPGNKNRDGEFFMVMLAKTVHQGIDSYDQGNHDHQEFKPNVVDDIDPENGKAGQYEGEQCTMYRTGY